MKIYAITPIEKPTSKLAKIAKKGVAVAAGIAMGFAAGSMYTNAKNDKHKVDPGNYGKVMVIIQNDTQKKYDYTQNGKFKYQFNDTNKSDNIVKPDKIEPKYEKVEPETLPEIKDVEPEKVTPEIQPEKNAVYGPGSLELITKSAKLKHDIKTWKESQEIYTDLGYMDKVSELQKQIDNAEKEIITLDAQIKENARIREALKNQ